MHQAFTNLKRLKRSLMDIWVAPSVWVPGLIAIAISTGVWYLGGWRPLERLSYNLAFQIREQVRGSEWNDTIAVIAIDEASLAEYGSFPWSRDRYTQLLRQLSAASPSVIGLDILFAEPTPDDEELAEEISRSGNIVLAIAWDVNGQVVPIAPNLSESAAFAHVQVEPDVDGITRRAALSYNDVPIMGTAIAYFYQLVNGQAITLLADDQQRWINWPGDVRALPTYSFADVAEGRIDSAILQDKVIIIGMTATGVDPLLTPLNQTPPTSGVYFHAAVADNVLSDRFLWHAPDYVDVCLILMIATGITLVFRTTDTVGIKTYLAMIFSLPLGWLAIAIAAFSMNLIIPVAAPIMTVLITLGCLQIREQREKSQLMTLFQRHVSPEMAGVIWRNRSSIFQDGELVPQEMMATVLFMDIRGFTGVSEKLSPRELLTWLNHYLDEMTNCIIAHRGVVDKYIGDAIMAVFGVPFRHTEPEKIQADAQNAIAASIAMHERLSQLNQELQQKGQPPIQFGIGIHTGLVVAGSVGGEYRLSYSVIGDTVNVAARLESMTKEATQGQTYRVLMSDRTYEYVRDRYSVQHAGTIQVRGRQEKVPIYTLSTLN
jgi:adenylate cyclase